MLPRNGRNGLLMRKRLYVYLSVFFVLALLCPAFAFGDAGTPLMWAVPLHLAVGNAIIGIGEGLVLSFVFKFKKRLSVPVMIIANYFSMITGAVLLDYLSGHVSITLYQGKAALWVAAALSFVATIFLEWPFIMFLFKKQASWLKRSLLGSLLVQSLSYLIIIPWYLVSSTASLYSGSELVHDFAFSRNRSALIYYIAPDDNVYKMHLSGNAPELVLKTEPPFQKANLSLAESPGSRSCDLYLVRWDTQADDPEKVLVRQRVAPNNNGFCSKDEDADVPADVHDLRPRDQREWSVWHGFWAADGLLMQNEKTDERIRLAVETPFLMWNIQDLSVLPGDEVVFQLGEDQICLFARNGRKLGLITRGRSPIVVKAGR